MVKQKYILIMKRPHYFSIFFKIIWHGYCDILKRCNVRLDKCCAVFVRRESKATVKVLEYFWMIIYFAAQCYLMTSNFATISTLCQRNLSIGLSTYTIQIVLTSIMIMYIIWKDFIWGRLIMFVKAYLLYMYIIPNKTCTQVCFSAFIVLRISINSFAYVFHVCFNVK